MNLSKDHQIAQAMCEASRLILWAHAQAWAQNKCPGVTLEYRVGRGKATHLKRLGTNSYRLNYGALMVANKRSCPEMASGWTTGTEIVHRGYFGGNLTLTNILAQTVIHEFAHFVQVLNGWAYKGSVHNDDFYRVCNRMHASGKGDEVRAFLVDRCGDLQYEKAVTPDALLGKPKFKKGDLIRVRHGGEMIEGFVTRVNKRTYSMEAGMMRYKVPFHMAESS